MICHVLMPCAVLVKQREQEQRGKAGSPKLSPTRNRGAVGISFSALPRRGILAGCKRSSPLPPCIRFGPASHAGLKWDISVLLVCYYAAQVMSV